MSEHEEYQTGAVHSPAMPGGDGTGQIYGLMAELPDEEALLDAVRRTRGAGYDCLDAYSPFPVEGLAEALGVRRNWVPAITLIGGILGLLTGYFLQYWVAVIAYPINVGGRPLNSWPYFIPITYEVTILLAAWTALIGMLILNGLPQPYHPNFNVPEFARASQDRFFMVVDATDPRFEYTGTRAFLQDLAPGRVYDVPV
jgi:hypothetical protein